LKSGYSHVLMLLSAILCFAPVLGIDTVLDRYVHARETAHLQSMADSLTDRMQTSVEAGIKALQTILADSASLCTPSFANSIHRVIESSLHVRQVLVQNGDGLQFCDAFGHEVGLTLLSEALPLPGRTQTIALARLAELAVPVIRISQRVGDNRMVSVVVPVISTAPEDLLAGLVPGSLIRVSLTNGTEIISAGDTLTYQKRDSGTEFVTAQAFAGELPLRTEAAVPFAMARAQYTDIDVTATVAACLMSGAFLLLALNYVRRTQLPSFDLERAIAEGEIRPYYQPIINLKTGRLSGCEVLCRWTKRNGEVVPPGAFIDYAEVTGLAIPMTISLMQQVKADLSDLCVDLPDIRIAINLFEGHFRDGTIVDDVQAIFSGSPISFRQLVFEITERRPLGNSMQASSVIAGLHALGARLAMDDVGTGHSNLAYMQTLGVDVIKIDRVFVDMIKADTTQVPVLDGLIAMSRDLRTDVVAEGVETEAQARYLRARGVELAQGWLFAPALRPTQFKELARALNMPKRAPGVATSHLPAVDAAA